MKVTIDRDGFTPLYYQLGEQLKRRIESGALRPEEQLPPEDVFAAELGVSRKTLRLSLDKLSKEGYVNRLKGRGTFVSAAYSRHRVLVVVVSDVYLNPSPWSMNELLGGIVNTACASGLELLAIPASQAPRLVESRNAGQADLTGVLFLRYDDSMRTALGLANQAGIPTIIEGATISGENYVDIDNASPMRRAVEYLAGLGHRKIGVLTYVSNTPHFERRASAARQAIANLGMEFKKHWLLPLSDTGGSESQRIKCGAFLSAPDLPSAFVTVSDSAAVALVQQAKAMGLQIPRDFSVTGFDDIPGVDLLEPPLTTFRQDYQRLGAIAAATLIEMSTNSSNQKRQIIIAPELIVRSSCAQPHGGV